MPVMMLDVVMVPIMAVMMVPVGLRSAYSRSQTNQRQRGDQSFFQVYSP